LRLSHTEGTGTDDEIAKRTGQIAAIVSVRFVVGGIGYHARLETHCPVTTLPFKAGRQFTFFLRLIIKALYKGGFGRA